MSNLISKIVVPDSSESTGYSLYNIKDANAVRSSEKGVASGVATLDSSGKVPSSQLPSYVDDVIEGYYNNGKFYDSLPTSSHDYVEIGGVKWATMNIGAESVTDTGLYFQWGDTQGYTTEQVGSGAGQKYFGWEDYKYGNGTTSPGEYGMTKYNWTDRKTVLDASDDAAQTNWGDDWRMPTKAEYLALRDASSNIWVNNYLESGVNGRLFRDNTDSTKTLFFPAAGGCSNGNSSNINNIGYYWSSSLSNAYKHSAHFFNFTNGVAYFDNGQTRLSGCSIRGVYTGVTPIELTPETGKIYVDISTNQSYRWSGSAYIVISSPYVLPTASANTLGGVKVGNNLSIDQNGVLSAESVEVVLTTGTSTTAVMSQKAVSDVITENEEVVSTALNDINDRAVMLLNAVTNHIENTDIHVTAAEKEYWNSKVNPPSYSAPTAKTLTYTGSAQDLLNAGSATAGGTIQYSTDETNWSTTIPQGTNAGTYTVYWRFIGTEVVYVDSTEITVTIAKANPTYTAPTGKSGIVYGGVAQNLINAGSTSDGTFSYSSDNENWSSSIPSQTNAGTYTVYWKLTGDTNHNDIAATSISVSIAKATPTVVAPTAKTGLTYTGSAQELIYAGSTNYGTLQYSADNENWGTTIPSDTNAGDYTVYYKVVGNSNIYNTAVQSVSCSIGKANRTVTISDNQTSMTPGLSNTITVTANPASSSISVTSSNTAVATISGTTINAVGGGTTTITATVASDANYNSGSASYSLNVSRPNGIYAAYADGSMRTAENADTNAIGVAVITDNCKFIIDKTNDTSAAWDSNYKTNGTIAGCFATNDENTAKTNYTGVSNTNAIAAVASGGEAAKYCKSCSKTIAGKTVYGYLGACGEWKTAYNNKSTVNSIMSTIGGTAISNTYYLTSTLYLRYSDTAWLLDWDDGYVGEVNKGYASRLVRPLYEIS